MKTTSSRPHLSIKEQFNVTRRIFVFTKPFRKKYSIAILWTIASAIITILPPRIIQLFMDHYLQEQRATLPISMAFAALYIVTIIVQMICRYFGTYFFSLASEYTVESIRNSLFEKINQLGMRFFDQTPAGSLVSRITNDTETIKKFWEVFLSLIQSLLGMTTVLIAMFLLNVRVTIYFLLVLPFVIGVILYYQKNSARVYRTMRERLSELNTKLNESILGMSIIQQFKQETRLQNEFNAINEAYYDQRVAMIKMNSLFLHPFIRLIQGLALVGVLYLFASQSLQVTIEIGVVYAFTSYIRNFFEPLGMLMDKLSILQDGVVSSSRVLDLLDQTELAPQQTNENGLSIRDGKIEFKNVTFSYDGKHPVLKNISFTIEPGQTVALVGHTGSGKSSIINLFLRFYEFEQGDILVDGHSIKEYPIAEFRRAVGLVLQDSFLFYGDIARNIRLLNNEITKQQIITAAQFVRANTFIERLPQQYHAKVIERGASYSSGERQLISFARTIIREPKILVLDEATANIDTQTEEYIQEGLKNMRTNRTTIAIAHRLSTIKDADLILVLDHGRIVERGTHASLLEQGGIYFDMYRLQAMD